jgi:hypothetical protein
MKTTCARVCVQLEKIGAEEPEECLVSMAMDLPLLFGTMPAYMEQTHLLTELDFTSIYENHQKVETLAYPCVYVSVCFHKLI